MESIDALVMGRTTFETVLGFGGERPYSKPVFVLSSSMGEAPRGYEDKVRIVNGALDKIMGLLKEEGFDRLYIDGGQVIQYFLKEDMIDEMIITHIPMLLGGGTPLFGDHSKHLEFEHVGTEVLLDAMVQSHYPRKR